MEPKAPSNYTATITTSSVPLTRCYAVQKVWSLAAPVTWQYLGNTDAEVNRLESKSGEIRHALATALLAAFGGRRLFHEHGHRTHGTLQLCHHHHDFGRQRQRIERVYHHDPDPSSEMERKLEEFRDVRKAYVWLTTDWTPEKNHAATKVPNTASRFSRLGSDPS
ncbi:hypothetical protein BGX23_003508 [Mortierella sp. AD031]|nr:hypothetical protein BGX23_003508 [Mortierella sp. AD031]